MKKLLLLLAIIIIANPANAEQGQQFSQRPLQQFSQPQMQRFPQQFDSKNVGRMFPQQFKRVPQPQVGQRFSQQFNPYQMKKPPLQNFNPNIIGQRLPYQNPLQRFNPNSLGQSFSPQSYQAQNGYYPYSSDTSNVTTNGVANAVNTASTIMNTVKATGY